MEHSQAHRILLQRAGGNVHPRDQIPSQIHDGTDGWKGKDSDGKMWVIPIAPELVESIHTWPSGLDQHETALWRSVQKPFDLRKRTVAYVSNATELKIKIALSAVIRLIHSLLLASVEHVLGSHDKWLHVGAIVKSGAPWSIYSQSFEIPLVHCHMEICNR